MQNFKTVAYLLLGFFWLVECYGGYTVMLWWLYCDVMVAILTLLILKASLATAEVSAGAVAKADQSLATAEVSAGAVAKADQKLPKLGCGADLSPIVMVEEKQNV
jgi:hypothetical protein